MSPADADKPGAAIPGHSCVSPGSTNEPFDRLEGDLRHWMGYRRAGMTWAEYLYQFTAVAQRIKRLCWEEWGDEESD